MKRNIRKSIITLYFFMFAMIMIIVPYEHDGRFSRYSFVWKPPVQYYDIHETYSDKGFSMTMNTAHRRHDVSVKLVLVEYFIMAIIYFLFISRLDS